MEVKLVSVTKGIVDGEERTGEELVAYAARVSSPREDKFEDYSTLLAYCIKHHHWSIFEQASMTLEITTSRAIGTQILRHWSFRFQEFSQRYQAASMIEPIELRLQAEKNRQSSTDLAATVHQDGREFIWNNLGESPLSNDTVESVARALDQTMSVYEALLKEGVAKECARMILPLATQTTIYMTGNIRSWLSFLNVRLDEHAQLEAQNLANAAAKYFAEVFPETAKATNYFNSYKGKFM